MDWLLFVIGSGIIGLLVALLLALKIIRQDKGPREMQEIARAIRKGAQVYLKRQYTTIGIIGAILTVILYFSFNLHTAFSFVLGVFCSLLAGYMSMDIATRANLKTASSARKGKKPAIINAFYGGAVLGLSVMSLSVLGIAGLYIIYGQPSMIIGFGFGASLAALFAQLGGGIYTKAADVGADLVGKIEKGIPEDDPRNPAVIADLVGDNVGDCAGRGADLFESVTGENIAAMILGMALYPVFGINGVLFPIVARAAGILATIIGVFFIHYIRKNENPMTPMWRVQMITTIISGIFFYFLVMNMLGEITLFYASVVGLVTSLLIGFITDYYTANHRPVDEIAKSSKTGSGTNIITGLSVGLESTALPVVVLSVGILVAYMLGGIWGTAVATMGMLATTGIVLAMDGFGPIADNAGGIVEMSGAPKKIRRSTDALDAIGNTTKALAKGFAVGSAALAAFLMFQAYLEEVGMTVVDITIPQVSIGMFIGALLPFIFSAFAIRAVGRAAYDMIEEVRRQFREIKGIMSGKQKPDYEKCVDISTKASLREMVIPGLLVLVTPLIVGFTLGAEAEGAFLMGATISGILLALFMNTGGAAWDNAKKYVEAGKYGGKGSMAHEAAIVGDTVGDPLKDTAGPSIHVLIKLLNTISLTFGSMFLMFALM